MTNDREVRMTGEIEINRLSGRNIDLCKQIPIERSKNKNDSLNFYLVCRWYKSKKDETLLQSLLRKLKVYFAASIIINHSINHNFLLLFEN